MAEFASPNDWKQCRLGELLREVDIRVRDLPDDEQVSLEVLSLTKDSGLIPQSERFGRRIATEDVSKYKVVRPGWIVYNPYVIWEGAIHGLRRSEPGIVSPVYPVLERTDDDGRFLDFLLRTPPLIEAYNRLCSGAVNRRRSIKLDAFSGITVNVPPLAERRAIGCVLGTVQRTKEATAKVIAATRLLKQSVMRHLFTYGPVRFDQVDQVTLKDTRIGPISEHWQVVPLGAVVTETQYGLSRRGRADGRYPILRMNNLVNGRVAVENLQFVDLGEDDFARFRLNKGDILFNRTNSAELVGKTAVFDLDGDFVFASYLIRVVPDRSRVCSDSVNYYLNVNGTQARLKQLAARAVSQSNINATKLRGFEIPLPPLSEQEEISMLVRELDRKIEVETVRETA
ncbi:MAG: restriction endonuclease subunit S, partial [Gaiellaceae bacterium]